MRNELLAVIFVSSALLFATPAMSGSPDIDVDIGIGGGGVGIYNDDYDYPRRRYGRYSCGEAKQLIRERGYYRIATIECQGRVYTFEASRRGNRYELGFNSRTGAVWRQ